MQSCSSEFESKTSKPKMSKIPMKKRPRPPSSPTSPAMRRLALTRLTCKRQRERGRERGQRET
eukprot:6192900-Pleurochrysis_carterae.AAC.1